MQFCSKLGYNYGFEGSDEEDISEQESVQNYQSKKIRKADTNIVSVKLDKLTQSKTMLSRKPIECKQCQAFMSHLSINNIKEEEQNKKIWTCEFCSESNQIYPTDFELPTDYDVTYEIEKPNVNQNESNSESVSSDNNLFVFCIDNSGSMDTGVGLAETSFPFSGFGANRSGQSRLDVVKSACIQNLQILKTEEPNKKVSLITFSNDVKYYGDCTQLKNDNRPLIEIKNNNSKSNNFCGFGQPFSFGQAKPLLMEAVYENDVEMIDIEALEIEANKPLDHFLKKNNILNDKQCLLKLAQLTDEKIAGISDSFNKLENIILGLNPCGSTALGPALVYSIGLCKRVGSQICLVTDGAANVGIGSLNGLNDDVCEQFYEKMANYALSKGIIVNVITVEGTDCRLAILGKLANITNGNLNVVDPLQISDEFKSILTNKTKATNVKVKIIVNHKYIYIRDDEFKSAQVKAIESNSLEEKEKLNELKKSVHVKDVGAAKWNTEVCFDYGIRQIKSSKDVLIDELPFQIQVEYKTPDEAKLVRTYTMMQKFTTDRAEAELKLNSSDLIFTSTTQNMASQVIKGNIQASVFSGFGSTAMANRLQLTQPTAYGQVSSIVSNLNRNAKFGNLNDQTANAIFGFSKCSSSTINSNNKN